MAFYGCTGLESITIPESVVSIGDKAFYDCVSLESITIPSGVTAIGKSVFSGCVNLNVLRVEAGNTRFVAVGGFLFDKTGGRILHYPAGEKHIRCAGPDGAVLTGESLFLNSRRSEFMGVFNKAAKTGNRIVPGCAKAESPIIPAGPAGRGNKIFSACKDIKPPIMADNLAKTGNRAFSGCTGLESVTIPSGVIAVGTEVFENCKNLKTLYLSRKTQINRAAFEGTAAEFFYAD
jgi:hypothetical protein